MCEPKNPAPPVTSVLGITLFYELLSDMTGESFPNLSPTSMP